MSSGAKKSQRKALGRGLRALISTPSVPVDTAASSTEAGANVVEMPVSQTVAAKSKSETHGLTRTSHTNERTVRLLA